MYSSVSYVHVSSTFTLAQQLRLHCRYCLLLIFVLIVLGVMCLLDSADLAAQLPGLHQMAIAPVPVETHANCSSSKPVKLVNLKQMMNNTPFEKQSNSVHKNDWLLKHLPKTQWLKMCFNPTSMQLSTHQCKSFAKGWHHKEHNHCHTTDLDTGNSFSDISEGDHMSCKLLQTF